MHRKFLFVDGERLVLGGRNVADHYVGARWRDLELDFRGPFAASCGSLVDATFDAPTARAPAVTGLVAGVPGRRGKAFIDAVTTLIEGAEATLDIEHAYLLSHAWLHEALLAAIARGVRVRAFSNSAESNDLSYMNWRLAMSLRALVEAGAEVYRRYSPSATLHTKLIVADGKRLVFGSSNLDYFSPAFCAELDVAIESASLGAAVTTWFERGLAEPTTRALRAGSSERRELERACSGWSVSRLCDLVLHDLQ